MEEFVSSGNGTASRFRILLFFERIPQAASEISNFTVFKALEALELSRVSNIFSLSIFEFRNVVQNSYSELIPVLGYTPDINAVALV